VMEILTADVGAPPVALVHHYPVRRPRLPAD
jgi:hypothetical protein